jgi:hypothetical protein
MLFRVVVCTHKLTCLYAYANTGDQVIPVVRADAQRHQHRGTRRRHGLHSQPLHRGHRRSSTVHSRTLVRRCVCPLCARALHGIHATPAFIRGISAGSSLSRRLVTSMHGTVYMHVLILNSTSLTSLCIHPRNALQRKMRMNHPATRHLVRMRKLARPNSSLKQAECWPGLGSPLLSAVCGVLLQPCMNVLPRRTTALQRAYCAQ